MKRITNLKFYLILVAFIAISGITFGQKYTGLTAIASDAALPGAQSTATMFDNDFGSRWQDQSNVDDASFVIDLGEVKNVGVIKIYWEGANASAYTLSFSEDNISFSGDIEKTGMAAGARTDIISDLTANCRYIKFQGVTRGLPYGYSIYEFEVYPPVTPELTSITVTPANPSIIFGASQEFTANGLDQIGNPIALTVGSNWTVDGVPVIGTENTFTFLATAPGLYTISATNSGKTANTTIDVLPANPNVSLDKTASASTGNATLAFDADKGSRWESATEDPQWIMVDLASVYNITDILITWETANAKDYIIETSLNGTDWFTALSETDLAAGSRTDRFYGIDFDARYVRLTGTARNTLYGYSIFDFQIFGVESTTSIYVSDITVTSEGDATSLSIGNTLQMSATVSPIDATNKEVIWSVDNESIASIDENGLLTANASGDVIVTATATDGSLVSGTKTITIFDETGLQSLSTNEVSIYPVPAKDFIYVSGNDVWKSATIYDLSGKAVQVVNNYVGATAINISKLGKGNYIIQLVAKNGNTVKQEFAK